MATKIARIRPAYANMSMVPVEVRLWADRRSRSQELKQLWEAKWRYCWQAYRAWTAPLTDSLDWWRSNEQLPTIFKIIETTLPRRILGMFSNPDFYAVQARQARSEEYEQLVKSCLDATIDEMNLFPKMYECLKYTEVMGHAWGKSVWREDYESRQVLVPVDIPMGDALRMHMTPEEVDQLAQMGLEMLDQPSGLVGMRTEIIEEEVYNGPDFEWRTLDRVFPDPTGDGEWYIEDIETTIEKLYKMQRELGVYGAGALNDLAGALRSRGMDTTLNTDAFGVFRQGTSSTAAVDYQREPESTEGIPNQYVTPMADGTGVRLQQCWGWVAPEHKRYPDTQWRLTVIAEGKYVLRDDPSPTPDQRPPYFPIKSIVLPGMLYGESVINWIGPLADQQSRLANMRLDQTFLNVWGQFMAKKDAIVSDNQLFISPGGIIELELGQGDDISKVFKRVESNEPPPSSYMEDEYRQKQAQDAAFANDLFQGAAASGGTTATEVQTRLQQGNAPHMLQVMYNDYTVARELLTRTWKWLQMRLPHTKLVRMAGDRWAMVNIADLQIPIDIAVGGGLTGMSKDARVQMDQELLQLTANPVYAQYIKADKVLMKWMLDRGWKSPESYVKTQEEVMLEQQMALMAQAQMGKLGPGNEGEGEGGAPTGEGGAPPPPPAEAGPQGQANQPTVPYMPSEAQNAALVGGQLAPGGLVTPSL